MKTTRTAPKTPAIVIPWLPFDAAKHQPRSLRRAALYRVGDMARAAGVPKEHAFWRQFAEALDFE
jgi:hypothetical protein